jgi:hypothetical protein
MDVIQRLAQMFLGYYHKMTTFFLHTKRRPRQFASVSFPLAILLSFPELQESLFIELDKSKVNFYTSDIST